MQPLVYYCRWHGAKLRLRGRDPVSVWGELVYEAGTAAEQTQRFSFILDEQQLTLEVDGEEQRLLLDEMGVVTSSSVDDLPR